MMTMTMIMVDDDYDKYDDKGYHDLWPLTIDQAMNVDHIEEQDIRGVVYQVNTCRYLVHRQIHMKDKYTNINTQINPYTNIQIQISP